jgi:hypothetical protein
MRENHARIPLASYILFHPSYVLFLQLLSRVNMDVPELLAEVTRAREAATTAEAACIVAMLVVETSAWEASVARDSTTLRVKDAENQAALAETKARKGCQGRRRRMPQC